MKRYTFIVRMPSGAVNVCTDRFSDRSLVRALRMMTRCGMDVISVQTA
ncbi:MAG TPA: hypothetical protein VIY48_14230 [Candidatus Paceibacterota bacterium]